MSDDTPHVDIDRIVHHARKRELSAPLQKRVNELVLAFQHFALAGSVEKLVQWAYDEGYNDGKNDANP